MQSKTQSLENGSISNLMCSEIAFGNEELDCKEEPMSNETGEIKEAQGTSCLLEKQTEGCLCTMTYGHIAFLSPGYH